MFERYRKERDPDHDLSQIHTVGLDEPNWVGVQVTGLAQYTVVQICAGANHSLAVDEWGSLFRDKVPARILLRFAILFFYVGTASFNQDRRRNQDLLSFIGPVFTIHRSPDPNFFIFIKR
jgi:hypothetical protein